MVPQGKLAKVGLPLTLSKWTSDSKSAIVVTEIRANDLNRRFKRGAKKFLHSMSGDNQTQRDLLNVPCSRVAKSYYHSSLGKIMA